MSLATKISNQILDATTDGFHKAGAKNANEKHYTARKFKEDLSKHRHFFPYFLKVNDEIIGLTVLGGKHQYDNTGFWIIEYGILSEHRGKGYGERFLRKIIDFGRDKFKKEVVYLNVATHNTPAYNLYKKIGFDNITQVMLLTKSK